MDRFHELPGNNEVENLYIDTRNFKEFGFSKINDLSHKSIIYSIKIKDKIYIGKSDDFNQRYTTHIKEARSKMKKLYLDFRNPRLRKVFSVIEVCDRENIDEREIYHINRVAQNILDKNLGKRQFLKNKVQIKNYLKDFIYNINSINY